MDVYFGPNFKKLYNQNQKKLYKIFFQPLALARASRSQALAAGVDISKHYSPDISFTIRVLFFFALLLLLFIFSLF